MAKKPKIEIKVNYKEVGKLLKSNEVTELCEDIAEEMVGDLGPGYEYDKHRMPTRYVFAVGTATDAAYKKELKENRILKEAGTIQGRYNNGK